VPAQVIKMIFFKLKVVSVVAHGTIFATTFSKVEHYARAYE
jgi:hypothetical protein